MTVKNCKNKPGKLGMVFTQPIRRLKEDDVTCSGLSRHSFHPVSLTLVFPVALHHKILKQRLFSVKHGSWNVRHADRQGEGRHLLQSFPPRRENLHTHTHSGVLLPSILPPCLWRAVKQQVWRFSGCGDDPKLLTGAAQQRRG